MQLVTLYEKQSAGRRRRQQGTTVPFALLAGGFYVT